MKVASQSAVKLMHDGILALARVEQNGIAIDMDVLEANTAAIKKEVSDIKASLLKSDVWRLWSKVHGANAKLNSGPQLASIIFERLQLGTPSYTETGAIIVDAEALSHIDHPFVRDWSRLQILGKLEGTYLAGIKRETIRGFIHPVFNLHRARSYRSSSDSPNFQNFPVRNTEAARVIRSCFIPRAKNRRLLEIDFGGIEVKVAACYHKDPTMLKYIRDPSTDMHRDMAIECFMLQELNMPKEFWKSKEPLNNGSIARYSAKNMFVFPQFYGDYFVNNAQQMWRAIEVLKLGVKGKSLYKWLAHKGIKELGSTDPDSDTKPGTFVHHIKQVEHHFWTNRFPVYAEWKKRWFDKYLKTGGFDMLTGFRVDGVYGRNDVINYPVQGAAFHCLLWCLIQLQRWLNATGMESLIVGQIHDSIVLDVTDDEAKEVLAKAHFIMTEMLPKHYTWIIVPMEVEAEMTPLGGSWFTKEKVDF